MIRINNMNCRNIFNCAAALIAEDPYDENNEDLLIRSVNIINTFIYNTYDVGNLYEMRVLNQFERHYREVENIDDTFPLCDDIAGICIYYLAAMLINNENTELSGKFYNEYKTMLNNIVDKIPADIQSISDIY